MFECRQPSGVPFKRKPSLGKSVRERELLFERRSRNKEPKIAQLDCPDNCIFKMNFRIAQNNL